MDGNGPISTGRAGMARTVTRATVGAIAGAAAWFTCGVIAVDGVTALEAFGLLPPLWVLGTLAAAGAAAAVSVRRPSTATLAATVLVILPWIVRPLAPLMIWTGPMALVIWALVTADALRTWVPQKLAGSKVIVAASVALLAGVVGLLGDVRRVTGDEPHYLIATSSMLIDGDVDLANDYDLARHQDFYPGSLEPRHAVLVTSGRQYPFHGLGASLLVLPGFAVAGVTGARCVMALLGILGLTLLWDAVRLITQSTAAAWATVAVLVLSIPFAGQIGAIYPDPAAAAVACLAIWTLARLELHERVGRLAMFFTGLGLSTLPWFHVRTANLALAFGLALAVACWRLDSRWRSLVALMAAPAVSAIAWFATLAILFDSLNPIVLFSTKAAGSLSPLPTGAFGLLWDQEYGLLVYAPAMIVALGGVNELRRRFPLTAWSSLSALATTFVVAASFDWWAGFSTPGRFLVPVLPVLALLVGVWYAAASALGRSVFAGLLALGASVLGMGAFAERGRLMMNAPDGKSTIFEWANPLVDLPAALPSLFRSGAALKTEVAIAAGWTLVAIMLLVVIWAVLRKRPRVDPFAVTAWAMLVWLGVGATIGWRLRQQTGWSADRAQMTLLQASGSGRLTTGWSRGGSAVRPDAIVETIRVSSPGAEGSTLLEVPWVPAGRYRIDVEHVEGDVALSLEAGRDAWPLWKWRAAQAADAPEFTLVTSVRSLSVKGEGPSSRAAHVVLAARGPLDEPVLRAVAERVTRYGRWLVYSLDRYSHMETGGFWCTGDRTTRIVVADVMGRPGAYVLALEAGPVPVRIRVESMTGRNDIALSAGQRLRIELPAQPQVGPISIDVAGGFRAADAFSNRGDYRTLGVWVSIEGS